MIVTHKEVNNFDQNHRTIKFQRLVLAKGWVLAKNMTFVYWTRPDYNNKYAVLTHADSQGNILYQKLLVQPSKDKDPLMLMLSEDEVIITLHRQNNILTVNLQTHEVNYLNHCFLKRIEGIKLFFFAETRLICIVEYKIKLDQILRLTYYSLPLTEESKPFEIYQSKLINSFIQFFKGNNHSMVVWSHNLPDIIELQIYNLHQQIQNRYRRILIHKVIQRFQVIMNVWSLKKGEVCIVSHFRQSTFAYFQLNVSVVSIQNMDNRQAKFQSHLANPQQKLVSCNNMGQICYFQLKQAAKKSRIVYIHNQTQEVINIEIREPLKGYKYFGLSYDTNMLYEICLHRHIKEGCTQLALVTRTVFLWQQMLLGLLLHLNQDFDDDLLKEAVQLIGYL